MPAGPGADVRAYTHLHTPDPPLVWSLLAVPPKWPLALEPPGVSHVPEEQNKKPDTLFAALCDEH